MLNNSRTKLILDELTEKFFNLFTNTNGKIPEIDNVYRLCIPETVIIKNVGAIPEIYTLEQFINPRKKILIDGTLSDFSEEEIAEKTDIFGNIAHRFCSYKKSGNLSGRYFEAKGMKTIQFTNTPSGWRISSLAWDDEREGLSIPAEFFKK
jgi:hypothetical protein